MSVLCYTADYSPYRAALTAVVAQLCGVHLESEAKDGLNLVARRQAPGDGEHTHS